MTRSSVLILSVLAEEMEELRTAEAWDHGTGAAPILANSCERSSGTGIRRESI